MQLMWKTDFALRTLLLLAHRASEDSSASVPVAVIAESFSISKDHVQKVVQELSRHGWVRTRRGRSGGVTLAADPEALTAGDVVAAFEGRKGVLDCVLSPEICVLEPGCRLRRGLIEAERAFYDILDGLTLAELASTKGRRGGLRNLTSTPS